MSYSETFVMRVTCICVSRITYNVQELLIVSTARPLGGDQGIWDLKKDWMEEILWTTTGEIKPNVPAAIEHVTVVGIIRSCSISHYIFNFVADVMLCCLFVIKYFFLFPSRTFYLLKYFLHFHCELEVIFSLKLWDGSARLCELIKKHDHLITSAIKEYSLRCSVSSVSVQSPTARQARFVGDDCQSLWLQAQTSNWCSGTMLSGKTIKFILYEVLQFAALTIPIFVIMERFARIIHIVQGGNRTAYWLVVAVSIAYVTTFTLLVWAPLKYMILKRRRFISDITQWWVQMKYSSEISVTMMNCLLVKDKTPWFKQIKWYREVNKVRIMIMLFKGRFGIRCDMNKIKLTTRKYLNNNEKHRLALLIIQNQ